MNLASQCQRNNMKSFSVARTPTLDRDLRIRRFHSEDTHRVHNLFLEETRCMLWPMFVQAVRSPPAVVLHVLFMFAGVIFARSFILALFGGIFAFSGVFVYVYHWFYNYLTSSLRGDLSNITQNYLSKAKCNFLVAEFDISIVGFIAIDQISESVASVKRISVDVCFGGQRKYIATKLLQEAFKFCQECGYNELVMEIPGTNKPKVHRLHRSDTKNKQDLFIARQG